jgi:hypothetical protein
MSSDEAPIHLRGMPRYYTIHEGAMWLWPVPDRNWQGAMRK